MIEFVCTCILEFHILTFVSEILENLVQHVLVVAWNPLKLHTEQLLWQWQWGVRLPHHCWLGKIPGASPSISTLLPWPFTPASFHLWTGLTTAIVHRFTPQIGSGPIFIAYMYVQFSLLHSSCSSTLQLSNLRMCCSLIWWIPKSASSRTFRQEKGTLEFNLTGWRERFNFSVNFFPPLNLYSVCGLVSLWSRRRAGGFASVLWSAFISISNCAYEWIIISN